MRAAITSALLVGLTSGCAFNGPSGGGTGDGDGDGDIGEGDGDGDGDGDIGPDAAVGHDEDGDTVPDDVDNCPGIYNEDQLDEGEINNGKPADGVGDACDPRPDEGGDKIILFDPFDGPLDRDWDTARGIWEMTAEGLAQTDASASSPTAYRDDIDLGRVAIETRVRIDELAATTDIRGVGLVAQYSSNNGEDGYACFDYENTALQKDYGLFEFVQNGATRRVGITPFPSIEVGRDFVYTMKVSGNTGSVQCGRQMPVQIFGTVDSSTPKGTVGLRAHRAAATYFHVTVYELGGGGGFSGGGGFPGGDGGD